MIHLDSVEHTLVMEQMDLFQETGFDLEDFGDDSIVIRSMPDDIMGVEPQLLFDALLNSLMEDTGKISLDFLWKNYLPWHVKPPLKEIGAYLQKKQIH